MTYRTPDASLEQVVHTEKFPHLKATLIAKISSEGDLRVHLEVDEDAVEHPDLMENRVFFKCANILEARAFARRLTPEMISY